MRLVVEVGSVGRGHGGRPRSGSDREFRVEKAQAVIGRGTECDLVLEVHGVSRQHARLQLGTGRPESDSRLASSTWYLIDLGTTNGTFLNGRRLRAHQAEQLQVGDRISIGSALLVVRDLAAPASRDAGSRARADQGAGPLMALHPAVRGVAALLFVAGLVLIVALLVTVLEPEPQVQEAVAPTAISPLDVFGTVLPTGIVPEELADPFQQVLTSLPPIGTREP